MDHRHQYDLQWQSGPWTSTWFLAAAQTTDIYKAFDGNMTHGTWLQAAAQFMGILTAFGCNRDLGHQYGLR